MVSGSAPLLSEVNSFMKVTMSSPMLEGYGQTESTGACFITASEDPTAGHVGGPVVIYLLFSHVHNLNLWTYQKWDIQVKIKMKMEIQCLEVRSG